MNDTSERKVLCTIEKSYHSERDEQLGKLRVYFELLPTGDISPINSIDQFCETTQLFVTSGFSDLKDKFGENLFEATCVPTRMERKDGDCRYVTRYDSCEEIKGLCASHVFTNELLDATDPRLFVSEKPITKTIMTYDQTEDQYYGPFEYEIHGDSDSGSNIELKLKALTTPLTNSLPLYHVGQYNGSTIAPFLMEINQFPTLIGNVKKIADKFEKKIDFITDEQIISMYGNKVAQSSTIRNFTKGTVGLIRKHFATSKEYRAFPDRFQRLLHALDSAESWDSSRNELLENFITDKEGAGRHILENYIEENKDRYFQKEKVSFESEIKKSLEEEHNQLLALKQEKEKLESENRRLAREQAELEVGGEEAAAKLEAVKKEELSEELQLQQDLLDKTKSELTQLKNKYNKFNTLEELDKEIELIERERERAKEKNKGIEEQLENIRKTLKSENDELTRKLVKLKPEVDALCGITPKVANDTVNYSVKTVTHTNVDDEEIREELIDNVLDALNLQGRKTDYYTAANILTTVAQCQFTLFSGLPGTGKTSLAKMLGTSLGLNNRLLNIPVARGWTSSRDVLGFYNALSQSFVSSATGLYDLLRQLDAELSSATDSAAAIVLLDEFNLSQPEHYFSPFMEMADPESNRVISTGDPEQPLLKIPSYLRFLGTINQDESVQALTPRMLDRAAIINFDDFGNNYDLVINNIKPLHELPNAISGSKFIDIFTPTSYELKDQIENILLSIVNVLRDDSPEFGTPILVSYRKLKAIRAYHNVASPLMYENTYAALDYAVCQHIIPLLNGYGDGFGKRLVQLQQVLPDEMEKSSKMLSRIIETGLRNMHSFGANI